RPVPVDQLQRGGQHDIAGDLATGIRAGAAVITAGGRWRHRGNTFSLRAGPMETIVALRCSSPAAPRPAEAATSRAAGGAPAQPHAVKCRSTGLVSLCQDATAPRAPAGPATRRYLLAGLLACGRCGRRLESAWSNGQAGLPVPPWPQQRRPPGTRQAEEHLYP